MCFVSVQGNGDSKYFDALILLQRLKCLIETSCEPRTAANQLRDDSGGIGMPKVAVARWRSKDLDEFAASLDLSQQTAPMEAGQVTYLENSVFPLKKGNAYNEVGSNMWKHGYIEGIIRLGARYFYTFIHTSGLCDSAH